MARRKDTGQTSRRPADCEIPPAALLHLKGLSDFRDLKDLRDFRDLRELRDFRGLRDLRELKDEAI